LDNSPWITKITKVVYKVAQRWTWVGSVHGLGKKGKVFPYSLPSVGPGADPGVQAVSPQVT